MLYNDTIGYSQPGLSYIGTIILNIVGISDPIILSNLNLLVSSFSDYSNTSTIAVISYQIAPSGVLSVEATKDQADAIIEAVVTSSNTTVATLSLVNNTTVAQISLTTI